MTFSSSTAVGPIPGARSSGTSLSVDYNRNTLVDLRFQNQGLNTVIKIANFFSCVFDTKITFIP